MHICLRCVSKIWRAEKIKCFDRSSKQDYLNAQFNKWHMTKKADKKQGGLKVAWDLSHIPMLEYCLDCSCCLQMILNLTENFKLKKKKGVYIIPLIGGCPAGWWHHIWEINQMLFCIYKIKINCFYKVLLVHKCLNWSFYPIAGSLLGSMML